MTVHQYIAEHTTYPTNFIKATDVVQWMRQLKLLNFKVHFFQVNIQLRIEYS